MRTNQRTPKAGLCLCLMLAVGVLALPRALNAQQQGAGAKSLLKLNRITTEADVQSVEPGDTVVMACPKCKDIWVTVAQPSFKGANAAQTRRVKQHQCPGCGSKRITKGHGKNKTVEYVHICTHCGNKDMTCSVMKKGAASSTHTHQH